MRGGEYSNDTDDAREFFKVIDVIYGDLDGDGRDEAAVSTLDNTGGTGQFTDVTIYAMKAGRASPVTSHGIGDRADGGVYDARISGRRLIIDRFGQENSGACCPTYIEQNVLNLRGRKLVAVARPTRRAYISLEREDGPVEVKFLRGGNAATIEGLADGTNRGHFFEANAGQTARITVPSARKGEPVINVGVRQGGGLVGSVSSGSTLSVKLRATDAYVFVLSGGDDSGYYARFDLEIR